MDETGLYTNPLPRTTFTPKGEGCFCVAAKDSIKDTAIVTLTANNSGHLFFVPTLGEESKIINGKRYECKKEAVLELMKW